MNELRVLVGLKIWGPYQLADSRGFKFGDKRSVTLRSGTPAEVGQYALHMQCLWVLLDGTTEITSSARAGGDNLLVLREVFGEQHECYVVAVSEGLNARVRLDFDNGLALEFWPSDEEEGEEVWRLFRPGDASEHFVAYGTRTAAP